MPLETRKDLLSVVSKSLTGIVLAWVMPSFLLTITAFLGQLDWRLDLTSHFRPWYLAVEAIALVFLIILRRKQLIKVTFLFLILNAAPLFSLYFNPAENIQPGNQFKVVQFNVCAPIKDYLPLTRFLDREKPDLVVLEECSEKCIIQIKQDGTWERYPYRFRKTPYRHRLLVLSQYPLKELPFPAMHADPVAAFFRLEIYNQPVSLFVLHSTRPSSGEHYYKNQIIQFQEIGTLASNSRIPFLMIGDLNVSPWNYSFGLLMRESHLRNSMDGFGFQPTFPTFFPQMQGIPVLPLLPIDHILVSKHFQVLKRSTGPRLQSDHLPVVVELGLNEGALPKGTL